MKSSTIINFQLFNCLFLASCFILLNACDGDKAAKNVKDNNDKNPAMAATHNHSPTSDPGTGNTEHAGWTVADYADSINRGLIPKDTMKGSSHRVTMANIGNVHVHIQYSSPGVKDRIVWGGLVPYETVWVTGAHQATVINFSKDVMIAGKQIPKGSYAFFTIPGKEKWIAILNSRYEQHLADEYNKEEDLLRVELLPEITDKTVERLTYTVSAGSDAKGSIEMEWEKIKISLPVITIKN